MSPEQPRKLTSDLIVTPKEVTIAIALARTGRADLVAAVMSGRMSVREAFVAARAGKGGAT